MAGAYLSGAPKGALGLNQQYYNKAERNALAYYTVVQFIHNNKILEGHIKNLALFQTSSEREKEKMLPITFLWNCF